MKKFKKSKKQLRSEAVRQLSGSNPLPNFSHSHSDNGEIPPSHRERGHVVCHPELDSGSINADFKEGCCRIIPSLEGMGLKGWVKNVVFAKQTVTSLPSYLHTLLPSKRKVAFTLAEVFHPAEQSRRIAFTLAEVLITLGIIGVVAALTMPTLITKYQQNVVETRVKKFYSEINNAVRMSVVDNGDVEQWLPKLNRDATYEENLDLLNKYFLPYIKYTEQFECGFIDLACAKLPNGSAFGVRTDGGGIGVGFWVNGKFDTSTRNSFVFQLNGKSALAGPQGYVVPFIGIWWDGNYDTLKTHQRGCYKDTLVWGNFCSKLLEQNGWKITKDYPW